MPRLIVADRNIPYVKDAFAHLGEVRTLPSSELDAAAVREAEVLLTRSTVKVNERLLAGSRVRFVATATIGIDHLDTRWLDAAGIGWASAPGSNAPAVAQWFATALLELAARRETKLAGRTVGIVGVGQVGSRVERVARALGCEVLRCDPPRAKREGAAGFVSLDELCAASDVVTLHVPLDDEGEHHTRHLFDERRLRALRPGAWLVNASRGPVVEGAALVRARAEGHPAAVILDVFEGEPALPPELVQATDLCTPHVAGHSLDGKAAGTLAVYRAVCAHLGVKPRWLPHQSLPPRTPAAISLDARALDDEQAARALLRRYYRIEEDDAALRRITTLPDGERGPAFQRYRDQYPPRREPLDVGITLLPPRRRALALMAALGARIPSE